MEERIENFIETIEKIMRQPNQFGPSDWDIWREMKRLILEKLAAEKTNEPSS